MVNRLIFKRFYIMLMGLLITGICLVVYFSYSIEHRDSFIKNKYYHELLKKDSDSFLSKVDEIGIRIDCRFRNREKVEKTLSNMGFRETSYIKKLGYICNIVYKKGADCRKENINEYILVYSDKEKFIDDYRKIKARFLRTYISLELINGDYISLTEKEYLKEYGKTNIDKNLFRHK